MSRIVKAGLIQTSLAADVTESIETIRNAQVERTLGYIDQAGREGVQILCMQEIFTGPYFCAEQNPRWYDSVEKIPDGPTTKLMQEYAAKYSMVIVVPLYEEESTGVYYNTAAVIDADGKYLGKYR
ncbi:MAG: nitrilase-related carbon-nitrogen hydrolase, partial [Thermoanaerobaculia bacterium]